MLDDGGKGGGVGAVVAGGGGAHEPAIQQVCVFVGGGLKAANAHARCLLWSGDEDQGAGWGGGAFPTQPFSFALPTFSMTSNAAVSLGGTLSFHKLGIVPLQQFAKNGRNKAK